MRPSLSVVILSIVQVTEQLLSCQDFAYEGKVCLTDDDGSTYQGILEVFTQGKWNTVCYDNTNREAASAACRQLGYTKYQSLNRTDSIPDNIQSVISGIRCPTVKSSKSVTETEIFLLRCDVGEQWSSSDCDRVHIRCDKEKSVYNGQVGINYDISDHAILEIYFEGAWRPICIGSNNNELMRVVADSACRQMGYTNVNKSFPSTINQKKSWKIELSEYNEEQSSYPCFTDYMNQSSGYTSVDDCTGDNENVYELTCLFNKSYQVVHSSGNQRICQYSSESTINVRIFYSVTGVLSVGMVILLVVVIVQCCRRRTANPPQAAQPNPVVRWWRERGGDYGAVREQREN